jgi:hypothetical protein
VGFGVAGDTSGQCKGQRRRDAADDHDSCYDGTITRATAVSACASSPIPVIAAQFGQSPTDPAGTLADLLGGWPWSSIRGRSAVSVTGSWRSSRSGLRGVGRRLGVHRDRRVGPTPGLRTARFDDLPRHRPPLGLVRWSTSRWSKSSPSRSPAVACTSTTPSPTSRTLTSTAPPPRSKISTVLCCVEPDETTTDDQHLRAVFGHAAPPARRMLPRQLVPRQRRRGLRVRRGLRAPHCRPACLRFLSPSTSTTLVPPHRTSMEPTLRQSLPLALSIGNKPRPTGGSNPGFSCPLCLIHLQWTIRVMSSDFLQARRSLPGRVGPVAVQSVERAGCGRHRRTR